MFRTDTLHISPEILRLIARIDEFKGAWRALGTLAPDRLSALRRVATIESIGSSTRIEGSKLTDREVEKLLSNLAIQTFETRDEQEVAGYAELMDLVLSSWKDIPFNETRGRHVQGRRYGMVQKPIPLVEPQPRVPLVSPVGARPFPLDR